MRAEEIIEKSMRCIIEQGGPAMEADSCRYRASNGRRCAAGCLIADEHYSPEMEGGIVLGTGERGPIVDAALEASGVLSRQLGLVRALQSAHDDSSSSSTDTDETFFQEWPRKLVSFLPKRYHPLVGRILRDVPGGDV